MEDITVDDLKSLGKVLYVYRMMKDEAVEATFLQPKNEYLMGYARCYQDIVEVTEAVMERIKLRHESGKE